MAWLTGYTYRKKITIGAAESAIVTVTGDSSPLYLHTGSGSDDTNNIYFDSKCKNYFDDIAITSDDGETENENFYLRNISQTSAELCVKATVDTSSVDIYIYYGNSSRTRHSDLYKTFLAGEFSKDGSVLTNDSAYNAHAGICRLHDGSLLVAYGTGTNHGNNDTLVKCIKSTDGGRTWGSPVTVHDDASYAVQVSMVAEVSISGTYHVLCTMQLKNSANAYDANRKVLLSVSVDAGASWGDNSPDYDDGDAITIAPTSYTDEEDARGIRCRIIEMSNGDIACAGYNSYDDKIYFWYADPSDLTSWTEVYVGQDVTGCSEPVIIEIKDGGSYNGDIYMIMRTDDGDLQRTLSTDYGATWSAFASSGITVDYDDGMDIIRLSTGEPVLTYCKYAGDNDAQIDLVQESAEDEDITWDTTNYSLAWRYRGTLGGADFAYPSICEIEDGGQIGLVFYAGGSSDTEIHFLFVELGSFIGSYFSHSSTALISSIGLQSWDAHYNISEVAGSNNLAEKSVDPSVTRYEMEMEFVHNETGGAEQFFFIGCDGVSTKRLSGLGLPLADDDAESIDSGGWNDLYTSFAIGTIYRVRAIVDEDDTDTDYYIYDSSFSALGSNLTQSWYGSPTEMDRIFIGSSSSSRACDVDIYYFTIRASLATSPAWAGVGSEETEGWGGEVYGVAIDEVNGVSVEEVIGV